MSWIAAICRSFDFHEHVRGTCERKGGDGYPNKQCQDYLFNSYQYPSVDHAKTSKTFLPFIVSFNLKRILQANVNTIAKFKVNFKQKVMMTQSCPGFPRNSVNYVEQKRRDQEREGVLYLALSKQMQHCQTDSFTKHKLTPRHDKALFLNAEMFIT